MAFYSVVNGLHHLGVEEFWAILRFGRQFKHPQDLLAAWNGFVKALIACQLFIAHCREFLKRGNCLEPMLISEV